MADQNFLQSVAVEATKSAPPVAVTSAVIAGYSINEWVAILTGLYVLLQIAVLVRKEWRESKARQNEDVSP